MIKARPVAGSIKLGEEFLKMIEPFVYRRYLDFTAIEEIRGMKEKIDLSLLRTALPLSPSMRGIKGEGSSQKWPMPRLAANLQVSQKNKVYFWACCRRLYPAEFNVFQQL